MPGANVAANGGVSSSTDSRHKVERSGPPQRIACSARISRRRSDRRQASVQQDAPPLRHSHDRKRRRRRRTLRPICSSQTSGAPKAASAEPAAGPPHPERIVRCTAKLGLRRWSRRPGRKHHDGGARSRDVASQHTASHRHFGEHSDHRPSHALHSHRSLQIRIERPITQPQCRIRPSGPGSWRSCPKAARYHQATPSAPSFPSALICLFPRYEFPCRGAFSRLQDRGFPVACPRA